MIIDTIVDIADSFRTVDNLEIKLHFGNELEQSEVGDQLSNNDHVKIMSPIDIQPETGELMKLSEGCIVEGRLITWVISTDDKTCVSENENWLNILYVSALSGLGAPGGAPFDYGDMRFWNWRPLGGISAKADRWGSYWVVEQLISFAALKITP